MAIIPYLNTWFSYFRDLFMAFFRFEVNTGDTLEISRAQFERERAEARAQLEARSAEIQVELETTAAARQAALDKEATREKRRCDAVQRRAEKEGAKLGVRIAELKALHGEAIPEKEWDALLNDFFAQWRAEDPPFFRDIFKIGFTEEPKPIQQPDNVLHRLLTQGVEEKVIDPDLLDEVTCPISYQVMQDPVKGEDGRTYDRFCLENIYYALPGTYPFNRQAMTMDPAALPGDPACYAKIQQLTKQCQSQLTSPENTEKRTCSSLEMSL